MLNRKSLFILMSMLLLISNTSFANNMTASVITLHYHTAKEMLPLIKPMMPTNSAIAGKGDKLIVKTTRQNLTEIHNLLATLDKAPRQLIILVRQGNLNHGYGNVLSGKVRVYSTVSHDQAQEAQQIQVLEGKTAFIQVGQSRPIASQSYSGVQGIAATIEYKDVGSGYYVTPYVMGNNVKLKIKIQRETMSREGGDKIDYQATETTMTVPIGKWIKLAGVAEDERELNNTVVYQTDDKNMASSNVYIKVDQVGKAEE